MENSEELKKDFSLEGKIEKFENRDAIIVLTNGQKVVWPINNLPEDAQVASEVRLSVSTAKTGEAELEKIAKVILNKILKTDQSAELPK